MKEYQCSDSKQSRIGQFMGNGVEVKKASVNPSPAAASMKQAKSPQNSSK